MAEIRRRRGDASTPAKVASSDGGRSGKLRPQAPTHVAEPAMTLGQWDWITIAALIIVCGFTRFWRLDKPPAVVFDETHFGRFTNQYMAGAYLFDIHPPLGKLVFVLVGKLVGYDYTKCGFANISDDYGPDCKYMALRRTAALFGTFTAPMFYIITRFWGGSILAGIVAASCFMFDGLNTGEDRLILTDSQLIFWCSASLLTALVWWRKYNDHVDAVAAFRAADAKGRWPTSREMATANARGGMGGKKFHFGIEIYKWTTLCGFIFANSVSIKWTGLATPGMIALESFFALMFLRRAIPFHHLIAVAIVSFATYTTYFALHFWLLPNTGDGDAFMKIDFQRSLKGNANYDPLHTYPGFWPSFYYLNGEMLSANARIAIRHAWESKWFEWPLNLRGILYYAKDDSPEGGVGTTATVYLLGNPMVLWPMLCFLGLTVCLVAFYLRYKREPGSELSTHFSYYFSVVSFCVATYFLNLLPYLGVKRSAFIYHYMPALMYAEILAALTMDRLFGPTYMPWASRITIAVMLAGFAYFAPWIYALPLTPDQHAARRWLPRWD